MGGPFDVRMADGSRHFAEFPEGADWYAVRDHVARLSGAELTGFLTDNAAEVWIDFRYRGHNFTIHNPLGSLWLFVENPQCDEQILTRVIDHFRALSGLGGTP